MYSLQCVHFGSILDSLVCGHLAGHIQHFLLVSSSFASYLWIIPLWLSPSIDQKTTCIVNNFSLNFTRVYTLQTIPYENSCVFSVFDGVFPDFFFWHVLSVLTLIRFSFSVKPENKQIKKAYKLTTRLVQMER